MSSRSSVLNEVIVIDSDDDDSCVVDMKEEKPVTKISSPSTSSPDTDTSYYSVASEPREPKFENKVVTGVEEPARKIKLEPTECSSAQYLESTHPTDSGVNTTDSHEATAQDRIEEADSSYTLDWIENSNQSPQLGTAEMNGSAAVSSVNVRKSPVKKLRRRKLLISRPLPPLKRNRSPASLSEVSSSKRVCSRSPAIADKNTPIGARVMPLQGISRSTTVSVIKSAGGNLTLPDAMQASECDRLPTQNDVLTNNLFSQNGQDSDLVTSTPTRPQGDRPGPLFHQPDGFTPTTVKQEPNYHTPECSIVRRKRKLCTSMEDTEKAEGSTTPRSDVNFLDSNIVFSHTKKNSRTQLCFIMQLQAQGFALPHSFILELVQDLMMCSSPSRRDTMYSILWSESERFPQATNREFLNQLFTTIIDSLMTTKYHHTENANMALHYLMNILCVDWRNSIIESNSYIATFLLTKVKQLLSEIRKFYEKPTDLFSPHVASTLQQLMCLPLAVIHEPPRLCEFSQSVFNEVFVELSREKQKMFLNNLSSPYLVTQLIATQLTNDYVRLESRDLLWSNHFHFIDNDWISRLLMLASPYLPDGKEDLSHMLWLMTQLLAKFVQRQRGGVVLSTPICVSNPLLAVEPDSLLSCTSIMKDFLDSLAGDEVIQSTCLFTPDVCYYMKLMMALIEEKTTSKNFDVWL